MTINSPHTTSFLLLSSAAAVEHGDQMVLAAADGPYCARFRAARPDQRRHSNRGIAEVQRNRIFP